MAGYLYFVYSTAKWEDVCHCSVIAYVFVVVPAWYVSEDKGVFQILVRSNFQ